MYKNGWTQDGGDFDGTASDTGVEGNVKGNLTYSAHPGPSFLKTTYPRSESKINTVYQKNRRFVHSTFFCGSL